MLSYCDFCEEAFPGEGVECEVPGLLDAVRCPSCSGEEPESQMTLGWVPVEVAPVEMSSEAYVYERALWEEQSLRGSERVVRGGTMCSCSYYTRLPCPHRAQLELFDTHGPECRGETGLPSGTLSHVTHDFPVSSRWGARTTRGRQRMSRPSWVAEVIAPPYVSFPTYQCTFARRQRY